MIIKITWNDNDFYGNLYKLTYRLGKCFDNFLTYGTIKEKEVTTEDLKNSLNDLIKCIDNIGKPNSKLLEKPDEESQKQLKRFEFKNYIMKQMACDELNKEDVKELEKILYDCALEIIDKEINEDIETKSYLKKNLKVKIVKSYVDKWENSESAYLILKGFTEIMGVIVQ